MAQRNQYDNPVTEEEREKIRAMHSAGVSRNEIARRLGRSHRTITIHANAMGLRFDRSATAVATEVMSMDAKALRVRNIQRLHQRIAKVLDRLDEAEDGGYKFTATTINGIETQRLDHVPGIEEKAMAGALTQYFNQVVKLEALDGDPSLDAARSMLGALAEGIQKIANTGTDEDSSLE